MSMLGFLKRFQTQDAEPDLPARVEVDGIVLDRNIVSLVQELNAFVGIETMGSCGGHRHPTPAQWAAGSFYVKFRVAHTEEGWRALEFLTWLLNDDLSRSGHHVRLIPTAPPPYLNWPGKVLSFAVEGFRRTDPEVIAAAIADARTRFYIPARS